MAKGSRVGSEVSRAKNNLAEARSKAAGGQVQHRSHLSQKEISRASNSSYSGSLSEKLNHQKERLNYIAGGPDSTRKTGHRSK